LQVAARNVGGAGQVAGVPVLGLAHVDDGDPLVEEAVDLRGVDLGDLVLDLADVLGAAGSHGGEILSGFWCFRKYSVLPAPLPPPVAAILGWLGIMGHVTRVHLALLTLSA